MLIDRQIDAFFCTVGHPSETVRLASSGERKVRIVPITGPDIDKLIGAKQHYSQTMIPAELFYPGIEAPRVINTFGVIATLCTSVDLPEKVVYVLMKEVFQNLEKFRRQHPVFRNLARKGMLEGNSAPLHPGALKYFREAGFHSYSATGN